MNNRQHCFFAFCLTTLLCFSAAAQDSAKPDPAALEEAKAHFMKGRELFDTEDYRGAVKEFKESYRLSKNPLLLYNIGYTLDQLGEQNLAIFYYEKFLKDSAEATPNRKAASERLKALEKQAASGTTDTSGTTGTTGTTNGEVEQPKVASPTKSKSANGLEHNVIEEAPPGSPIDVTAVIPEGSRWNVFMYFRVAGQSEFVKVPMQPRYRELIGRIPEGATKGVSSIQYYVEARERGGEVVARSGQATSPHILYIEKNAKARFYPDWEGGGNFNIGSGRHRKRGRNDVIRWSATGTAGGLLALSVTFYLLSSQASASLEGEATASTTRDDCPSGRPCRAFSDVQKNLETRGKRFETLGNVTMGLAAVGVGVAGWYWYQHLKSSSSESEPSVPSPDDNPLSRVRAAPVLGKDFIGGTAVLNF